MAKANTKSPAPLDSAHREWLNKMVAILGASVTAGTPVDRLQTDQNVLSSLLKGDGASVNGDGSNVGPGLPGAPFHQPVVAGPNNQVFGPATDRSAYEDNLRAIQAKLPQIVKETPPDDKTKEMHTRIKDFDGQMRVYASIQDFKSANESSYKLLDEIGKYEKARDEFEKKNAIAQKANAKTEYEANFQGIKDELEKLTNRKVDPNEPAAQKRQALIDLKLKLDQAISTGMLVEQEPDYVAANKVVLELKKTIADYKASPQWKERYEAGLKGIKDSLEQALDKKKWTDEVMKAEQSKVEPKKKEMDDVAAKKDYYRAVTVQSELSQVLDAFHTTRRSQEAAKIVIEIKWKAISEEFQKVTNLQPAEPELQKVQQRISPLYEPMKAMLLKGDYIKAEKNLDQIEILLLQYRYTEKNTPKYRYETGLKNIGPYLTDVQSRSWQGQEMPKLQKEITDKKGEMENAAAKKDYLQAVKHLEALTGLVHAFLKESRLTGRTCDWIRDTAGALGSRIDEKYLRASSRLFATALTYKTALQRHKDVVSARPDWTREFLTSLFFAGIGGAVGGAIGAAVKNLFDRTMRDFVRVGTLVTATSDISKKFVTLSLEKAGKSSPSDPLAGIQPIKGDALDLALSMSQLLMDEAAGLKAHVTELFLLVRDNPKCIKDEKNIRLAGDPIEMLDNDPFLKILGGIVPDIKKYAELIWIEWAKDSSDLTVWKYADHIHDQAGSVLDDRINAAQKKINDSAERRGDRR